MGSAAFQVWGVALSPGHVLAPGVGGPPPGPDLTPCPRSVGRSPLLPWRGGDEAACGGLSTQRS
jgi:hypothetical protein